MLPPAYFFLAILLMVGLHMIVPIVRMPTPLTLIGVAPLVLGIVLAAIANRLFHKRRTPIHPFMLPSSLVVDGPFKYSRNPMYLGMVLAMTALALLLGTVTPWLVIPPFVWLMTVRFVRQEEQTMEQQFGTDYLAYKKKVRRWV